MSAWSVELYGRLREAGERVELNLEAPFTAGRALEALRRRLGPAAAGAALATEAAILSAEDLLPPGARLALLPPVCGG